MSDETASGRMEHDTNAMVRLLVAGKKNLSLIVGLLTITGFLSGLAYFRAYLGALGFEGLIFSLPFEMYLVAGGISVMVALLSMLILVLLLLSLHPFAVRILQKVPHPRLSPRMPDNPFVIALAASLILAVAFIWPWTWLARVESLVPFPIPLWATLLFLLLLIPLLALAYGVTSRAFRGGTAAAYGVAILLASAPIFAQQAGDHRATRVFDHLDDQTRALVWWTPETTSPEGYVVIHQEGNLVYLVTQIHRESGEKPVFHSTVADVTQVPRIVFVAPGLNLSKAYPPAPAGAS